MPRYHGNASSLPTSCRSPCISLLKASFASAEVTCPKGVGLFDLTAVLPLFVQIFLIFLIFFFCIAFNPLAD